MCMERLALDNLASTEHKIYMFHERDGLYDLNVQVAFLVQGTPHMIFLQGDENKTSQCQMTPGKGPNGENFFVCPCYIRPQTGGQHCSAIVDDPDTAYAYKLHGWNYASP
jgi:hypothetical protein